MHIQNADFHSLKGNRMKKCKIYSSKKYVMSDEDRKHFERIFQKESEKYERDSKCGGVSESGYAYKTLHDRYDC